MFVITGGAGFIGSAMIWRLNQEGIDDIVVVDNLSTSEKWKNLVNRSYYSYIHRDEFIRQVREDKLPDKVEAIVHLGACSSTTERDADFLISNNVNYSKQLSVYAEYKGIRFINASSAATYGDGSAGFDDDLALLHRLRPLNMYGYSKHLFDLWACKRMERRQGLSKCVSLKFFNVYGPNEAHKGDMRSVINKAYHSIRQTGAMELFRSAHPGYEDGGQMRDFIYVKDCVEVMWWLIKNPRVRGVFNVGSGQARAWNDLVRAVFASMDLEVNIKYIDMPLHLRDKYQNFTQANMTRLHAAGYRRPFYSLEEGVDDYVRNYLMNEKDPYLEFASSGPG
ncbi:MAG: ADP-glyceromanno-heptose 6-epimerase [Desulfarculales bacterium]|jgi:ADP-L-glycero-D-manno-heptose 6-epimerase|nr:ADP-glyceromanno-heptose 6-epimerase [Desulfarculales bacterium]